MNKFRAAVTSFTKLEPEQKVFAILLGLVFLWLCVAIPASILHRMTVTPEEARAEAIARAQQESQWNAQQRAASQQDAAKRALCELKSTCEQFSRVRQECATAGDFQTCIRVKMGDEKYQAVGSCTNDGHIAFAPESGQPGEVECFLNYGIH